MAKCIAANLPRDSSGLLAVYAWPGGYPLFYIERSETGGESIVCPYCATETERDTENPSVIVAGDVNWEDPSLYCEACGERIESAYAEPDTGGEEE